MALSPALIDPLDFGMLSGTRWSRIFAAQGGDDDALGELCTKYRPPVAAYLRAQGMGEESEDLAQEVMIQLLRALARVDPSAGRFRGLVFAITRHCLSAHRRREGAQKRGGGLSFVPLNDLHGSEEPDADFDREWVASIIDRALERLAADQPQLHETLVAHAVEGRSYSELSKALDVSEGALRKRVLRARRRLSGFMKEEAWLHAENPKDVEVELDLVSRYLPDRLREE